MIGSLIFVALNLHHYVIDATIWRAGGEHVARISRGPAVPVLDEAQSDPLPVGVVPQYA